jgi:two-component system, OmpR family, response regulator
MRVLIVDDYHDAAEASALLLDIMGHETCIAKSGAEALEQFDVYRPDILLLDIGLPDLSGYEVAREVRLRDRGRSIFIVALTGWGSETDRATSVAAGIDMHVLKPPTGAKFEEIFAAARAQLSVLV